MKDTVIKGNGKSHTIKAPDDMPATWDEWREQAMAGNAHLDIALNTDTEGPDAGVDVVGTPANKNTFLTDKTAEALELEKEDPTVDDALYALSQKTQPAELHVLVGSGVKVTAKKGQSTVEATADGTGWAILYLAEFGEWTLTAPSLTEQKFTIDAIAVFYTAMQTLEKLDWAIIGQVAEMGLASKLWKIGDLKSLSINGETVQAQIIGFDHDTKQAGGTAGITFQLQDCMKTTAQMETTATNANGWEGCQMRKTTLPAIFKQLPATLQSAIKTVNKVAATRGNQTGLTTSHDQLFLLSEIEIFGATTYSVAGEGKQYAFYAAGNSTIKKVNSSANDWWERSPVRGGTGSFCCVYSYGSANGNGANDSSGVSFGFCV